MSNAFYNLIIYYLDSAGSERYYRAGSCSLGAIFSVKELQSGPANQQQELQTCVGMNISQPSK